MTKIKLKRPIRHKIRICVVVVITLFILLSNFFMAEIAQKGNKKVTNEEEILENFECVIL